MECITFLFFYYITLWAEEERKKNQTVNLDLRGRKNNNI